MKYPNLSEEKKLWKKGYKIVLGLDEAGRGPLAGPVVAAAVSIPNTKYRILNNKIKDSKQLSPLQREIIYKAILKDPWLQWGIGIVSNKVIDKINILEATKLAMAKAVGNLNKKLKAKRMFLIIDGNTKLDLPLPQKSIIKGDKKVFSCAAASILAKVTRDRMMMKYHREYPRYRFDLHKGYGTKQHFKLLKKHKPCRIHRRTFYPVSAYAS